MDFLKSEMSSSGDETQSLIERMFEGAALHHHDVVLPLLHGEISEWHFRAEEGWSVVAGRDPRFRFHPWLLAAVHPRSRSSTIMRLAEKYGFIAKLARLMGGKNDNDYVAAILIKS